MLYSRTHMAAVGVKGLIGFCRNFNNVKLVSLHAKLYSLL